MPEQTKYLDVTELQCAIMDVLNQHKGSGNRITRPRLRLEVTARLRRPVTDRTMRNAIEDLRYYNPDGAYICSSTTGGYWLAASKEELDAHLTQDIKRALRTLSRIKRQKDRAGVEFTNPYLTGLERP